MCPRIPLAYKLLLVLHLTLYEPSFQTPLGSAAEQPQSHREAFPGTHCGMASYQLHHPSDEGEMKVSGVGQPSAPLELGAHAL